MQVQSHIGRRIQLHPATDQWMRGDRYGEIVSETRHDRRRGLYVMVRMDRSGRTIKVYDHNIGEFVS